MFFRLSQALPLVILCLYRQHVTSFCSVFLAVTSFHLKQFDVSGAGKAKNIGFFGDALRTKSKKDVSFISICYGDEALTINIG